MIGPQQPKKNLVSMKHMVIIINKPGTLEMLEINLPDSSMTTGLLSSG